MKIKEHEKYDAVIVEIKGDLVGGPEAADISERLHDYLKRNKKHVVVDLSNVKFVNSSGIGILISGYTTMKNAGGELKLANLSDKVTGVLSITKLNSIFDTYSSIDEAVKSF